jgi:hypothetical protein
LVAGVFGKLKIAASWDFGVQAPRELPRALLRAGGTLNVFFHTVYSPLDYFAYAIWANGALRRGLAMSADSGVIQDDGERLDFELSFWEGSHDFTGDDRPESYPFPFHPLEFGQEALRHILGFILEGMPLPWNVNADRISLLKFKRKKLLGFG